jgi:formate C-acetyltransferase
MSITNKPTVKEPYNLSPRIQWLRDYYFKGAKRNWKNESIPFGTGAPWDIVYDELTYYIVPESYPAFSILDTSLRLSAQPVPLCEGFWDMSLVERRAWFNREVIVNHLPQEILPGDLICGARFNVYTSRCLNEQEAAERRAILEGPEGVRQELYEYHDKGYGNAGATSGHLVPGYEDILKRGFIGVKQELDDFYAKLSEEEKNGTRGAQLRAMMTSADIPVALSEKYANLCQELAKDEKDETRKAELLEMEKNARKVPYNSPENFWEALQALWITHMLVMSDENYPGPGVSFGRIDQYLLPYYEKSVADGMDREFMKELLKCFFIKCNFAYDSMINNGNNGITAGFGQLMTLSGMGAGGKDMTNDLTWLFLEVIDEMYPILEPKPSVRLHKNSSPELITRVAEMISTCQGAPFLLNFDERSMAGMLREAKETGLEHLINEDNVFEYAPVGCLENTMVGNDRSGTVNVNLNLIKAVELALANGEDITDYYNSMHQPYARTQDGPKTGDVSEFKTFEEFYTAFEVQLKFIIEKTVDFYNKCDIVRADTAPTPYLSLLVKGCAKSGKDVTAGGAEIRFVTLEGVTFATTVDSLLAVKYLVFDKKLCTLPELVTALRANWVGYEVLQATAKNKAPKYGRDDDEADELARRVMELWSQQLWGYKTPRSDETWRAGMLSWNYWAADGSIVAATPDGRSRGQYLSNAICPSSGADINGPTSNINSAGKVLGGKCSDGDFGEYVNYLPNGASHTITLSPAIVKNAENKGKFEALLKGYINNGGTALQINILDPDMLRDAQKHPGEYKNLLVRVTGYNAYFTTVGKELQDEIIERESHNKF